MTDTATWRLCSSCKRELPFEGVYYACSVSTCNRRATGYTFCSVPCWEAHVPLFRHRDAWAEEKRAPSRAEWEREQQAEQQAVAREQTSSREASERRRVVQSGASADLLLNDDAPEDILIVASKLKKYIRARSGMNTSDGVMPILSDMVRQLCDEAIRKAAADERKTVMPRDF